MLNLHKKIDIQIKDNPTRVTTRGNINGLVQDCSNSSALLQSCTKLLIYTKLIFLLCFLWKANNDRVRAGLYALSHMTFNRQPSEVSKPIVLTLNQDFAILGGTTSYSLMSNGPEFFNQSEPIVWFHLSLTQIWRIWVNVQQK